MTYRTANYAAFYVKEPFSTTNLSAYATPDFLYYNQLRAWKSADSSFPFIDAHEKTYSVRDSSQWETLKQRLHDRLNVSKNIILFIMIIPQLLFQPQSEGISLSEHTIKIFHYSVILIFYKIMI